MKDNKNRIFGRYPCCDMINNAIRYILNGDTDSAIEELLQIIWKAKGYIREDIEEQVDEIRKQMRNKRNIQGNKREL